MTSKVRIWPQAYGSPDRGPGQPDGPVGARILRATTVGVLRITCDTAVVIDALERTRQAAVDLFAAARAGELDVAFATRLAHELKTHSMAEVSQLVGSPPNTLGSTGRYGVTRYGTGDVYGADSASSRPTLLPSSWRMDFSQLGVDTYLGGAPDDLSTPTMEPVGKLRALDSDHLEAHRRAGRDVFVTSDGQLIKAAREHGIDAVTPEDLLARLRGLADE